MYRSTRLPVCGQPATGRYRQNQPLAVDFDRRRSISIVGSRLREKSIVGGQLREKKGRRRRGKEERRGEEEYLARTPLPPAGRSRAVLARASPASHPCPHAVVVVARGSPAGDFSPARGERSR
ncbi:hypothetical protein BHE74_00052025 [Ensete ventricosum]|nr:hypothetical protein BHE74_00052025 [Ensete ventricosum]